MGGRKMNIDTKDFFIWLEETDTALNESVWEEYYWEVVSAWYALSKGW
jgi:hypothetical protein